MEEMRSGKEITNERSTSYSWEEDTKINTELILEVLLDIRDLLIKEK